MTTDQSFWKYLEDSPQLAAPLIEWQSHLADWPAWPVFQSRFLQLTREKASAIDCPTECQPWCPRRIVAHTANDIVAICPEGEEKPFSVTKQDLLVYRLTAAKFHLSIAEALRVEPRVEPVSSLGNTWQIGTFPVPGGDRFAVFFSSQNDDNALTNVIERLCLTVSSSFILLSPTRRYLTGSSEELLAAKNCVFVAINEELLLTAEGKFQVNRSPDLIFRRVFPDGYWAGQNDPLPANIFRQRGSQWEVRFQGGEIFFINDQKGAEYIAILLSAPHESFSVIDLYHGGKATDEVKASLDSSGFEAGDMRCLRDYNNRLTVLDREIEEADDLQDFTQYDNLQIEKEKLLAVVKEIMGKSNKKNDPQKKARDAVNRNLSRTIESIAKAECTSLADHLKKYISPGGDKIYQPPDKILWDTLPASG